ncbi:MAG: glycosyltransferase [Saprospiraceae bacterium]|nr:glycosyltransferase [Saprospiraceae bacterium]
MKILLLSDNLANAKQWKNAMINYAGVEIIEWNINAKNKAYRSIKFLLSSLFIKQILKKYNADIVIGYRTTSYGFLAARSGIHPCVIAAQGENDIWPITGITVPFKKMIRRYACAKSDLIHAWGEHMKQSILLTGVEEDKIIVRPRGIDLELFKCSDAKIELQSPFRLISTRSLYPEYGHEVIINALKIVKDKGYRFLYTIAGDGPNKQAIEEQIKRLGLEKNIKLVGKVKNEDLPQLLLESDFYVSMPHTEGVSASLFEAMACGCFPIVSDLKANRLFITDSINGYLVSVGDYQKLASVVIEVIKDSTIWKKAIAYNLELVKEKADLKKNIQFFVEKYKELLLLSKH